MLARVQQLVDDMDTTIEPDDVTYGHRLTVNENLRVNNKRLLMTWDRQGDLLLVNHYV